MMSEKDEKMSYIVREFEFERITREGVEKTSRPIAVEESFDLIINGTKLTSIFASPSSLKELGIGYLISEGIVGTKDRINSVEVIDSNIIVTLNNENLIEAEKKELKKLDSIDWKNRCDSVIVKSELNFDPVKIFKAIKNLDTEMYRKTRGTHSAILIDDMGREVLRSIDTGRHNTFNKIIGKAVLNNVNFSETILLASGRQSASMILKAANAGIPVVITQKSPLSSGIEAANHRHTFVYIFIYGYYLKVSEKIRILGKYRGA